MGKGKSCSWGLKVSPPLPPENVNHTPVQLVWGNDVAADVLYVNAASWHHFCHIKFAKAKVDRIQEKKRQKSTDTSSERRSKRKLLETDNALCIFCGKV